MENLRLHRRSQGLFQGSVGSIEIDDGAVTAAQPVYVGDETHQADCSRESAAFLRRLHKARAGGDGAAPIAEESRIVLDFVLKTGLVDDMVGIGDSDGLRGAGFRSDGNLLIGDS